MAKVTKAIVDKYIRNTIFSALMNVVGDGMVTEAGVGGFTFHRINDRQWGTIVTDANGEHRYVRVGAIVAELREDMTAEELMASECEAYNAKLAEKAEKEKVKQEKIAKDKARREAEKAKKEAEENA
jgi:hypothetical protein